jgi:arsenate reductase
MAATIYHNPRCSTSRQVLALLKEAGEETTIVEYLRRPPSRKKLKELLRAARVPVREAIRKNEALYAELGLADESLSDDALLDAMVANPILIQRPIVETPRGVRICRPAESVKNLL